MLLGPASALSPVLLDRPVTSVEETELARVEEEPLLMCELLRMSKQVGGRVGTPSHSRRKTIRKGATNKQEDAHVSLSATVESESDDSSRGTNMASSGSTPAARLLRPALSCFCGNKTKVRAGRGVCWAAGS